MTTEAEDTPNNGKKGKRIEDLVNWGRTQMMEIRVFNPNDDPEIRSDIQGLVNDGKYLGKYHFIGRDRRINKGIYLGAHPREAILVLNNAELIVKAYEEVKKEISSKIGAYNYRGLIPSAIFNTVKSKLRYDEIATKQFVEGFVTEDKKEPVIPLDQFINEGYGVCRHMGLFCAVLFEKFIDEGILVGDVSVDRNSIGIMAHAWCRYKSLSKEAVILDVAQKYIGPASAHNANWFYERPEDRR
ncbi:hypothetical protein HN695_05895 [Candidatus Woesearchaeota archaeon]|nr:hypothetical protein [Candidatus Woesearchaeota archaeon]MBT5272587.1 hypothetical protein [Candidatus Woesearchaeota archaeon]MBT6040556.1 hypothetical protein [Candidatus Woesearchaeota archaeon]MBT6337139.1 hypothetical protein [Candidatus Woesearchaeota archaeon]MBT7927841.1 hypothetical protein [Candidatus Woesearchaeota archaeon]